MLRRFLLADKNHGNIPAVALLQDRIGIYIHFAEDDAEFLQQRPKGGFGFVAEVASGSRIESDVPGAGSGKAGVFWMRAHRFGAKLHLTGSGRRWEQRGIITRRSVQREAGEMG